MQLGSNYFNKQTYFRIDFTLTKSNARSFINRVAPKIESRDASKNHILLSWTI